VNRAAQGIAVATGINRPDINRLASVTRARIGLTPAAVPL
jgi:hypothetical protein